MYGYSRVKAGRSTRSMSIDFSDLSFSRFSKPKPVLVQGNTPTKKPAMGDEEQDGNGENFGAILSRNSSVSSTCSSRRLQSQSNGQVVVQRVISMRRSSSVGGGYCRIHDQPEILSPSPEDRCVQVQSGSKKRKTKILKACKKLFGFH